MIRNQLLMTLKILLPIFLVSCGVKLPLVTLTQIDATHNQANPFHIIKYDDDQCKLDLESKESFSLVDDKGVVNPRLNGGVWVSAEDYAEIKKVVKTDCEYRKKIRETPYNP